jgi:hypothetical protein
LNWIFLDNGFEYYVKPNKNKIIYIIKEFVQPKKSLSTTEFLIWKERGRDEREGVREKGVGR